MSYSRWLSSSWYTFWASNKFKEKEYQQIEIMYSIDKNIHFYYYELKNNFEGCIERVKEEINTSVEEIEELKIYLNEFIKDVEKEFNNERFDD